MIYIISVTVFSAIIFMLVAVLLLVEAKLTKKGDCTIIINDDPSKGIRVPSGVSLLSALVSHQILLPSACGGGGACGMCKCKVIEGGGSILPTELSHISRAEQRQNIRLACQLKVKEDLKIRIPNEIFNIKKYHATVVSNENVATFIKELVLKLDPGEELIFNAGAYIQIDIPEYELSFSQFQIAERFKPVWDRFNLWGLKSKSQEAIFRAYSLANHPAEKDILRFTIRIATPPPTGTDIPPGRGSSFIFNLKPGDRVTLSGPYGEFFVKNTDKEMIFIGGGAGMAPLRSQIYHQLLTLNTKRKMSFWYGARSRSEMFYYNDFMELQKRYPNFSFYVALSNPLPEDKWDGLVGHVHICLYENYLKNHPDPTEIEFYLCGPPPMIEAVEKMLDNLGVEPEMIAYDKF